MKRVLTIVAAAAACAASLYAQDPVKADPKHYKAVAENDHLRVLKASVAAGDKGVMHEHPDNVVVFLTDATVRFGLPDGTMTPETKRAAGDVMIGTAGKHRPENQGAAMEAFVIELKPGAAKVPAAAPAPLPAPPAKMTRTLITSNEQVEAYHVKVEAGFAEGAGSTHAQDLVVIPVSGTGISITMGGKTTELKKGDAFVIPRGTPHEAKSSADGESIVVYVK
jgi:quercetin dioxygenase-like cupin family protein